MGGLCAWLLESGADVMARSEFKKSPHVRDGWIYYTDGIAMVRAPRPDSPDSEYKCPSLKKQPWEHAQHNGWEMADRPEFVDRLCQDCDATGLRRVPCETCDGFGCNKCDDGVIAVGLCGYCEGKKDRKQPPECVEIAGVSITGEQLMRTLDNLSCVEFSTRSVADGNAVIFRAAGGVEGIIMGLIVDPADHESTSEGEK